MPTGEGAAPAEAAAQAAPTQATDVAAEVANAVAAAVAQAGAVGEEAGAGVKRQLEGGEVAAAGGAPPKRAMLGQMGADGEEQKSAIKVRTAALDSARECARCRDPAAAALPTARRGGQPQAAGAAVLATARGMMTYHILADSTELAGERIVKLPWL